MTFVTLREISRENWREALELGVKPEQQRFVADYEPIALVGLAKAYVRPLGLEWIPYAVYAGYEMVGFVELAYEPDSTDQYWMYHFFIDQRYQGKGYGKLALASFIEQVQRDFPECRCISLTVQPDNRAAQQLYTWAGFLHAKEEVFGEPVFRLKL